MAADLYIHVTEGLSEETEKCFFGPNLVPPPRPTCKGYDCVHMDEVEACPSVHVGDVSWLKASLFDEVDKYVPAPVYRVSELLPSSQEITPELVEQIDAAFDLENKSIYKIDFGEKRKRVNTFLRRYMGRQAFVASW